MSGLPSRAAVLLARFLLLLALGALLISLDACSVLGDRRTAAACQLADGATTYHALRGGAVEANPLLDGASAQGILLLKALFAVVIYWVFPEKPSDDQRFALGAVSVLGCGAAVHNYGVIRRQ